jgi:hypothetical protein
MKRMLHRRYLRRHLTRIDEFMYFPDFFNLSGTGLTGGGLTGGGLTGVDQTGRNPRFDLLNISGLHSPDPPFADKLVSRRLTKAIPLANVPRGPPADEIELDESFLQFA